MWETPTARPVKNARSARAPRIAPATINGQQVAYEPDGSWEIVVAERDPGHANWVSTQNHRHGLIWFRWFLPDVTPDRPTTRVVEVAEVADL